MNNVSVYYITSKYVKDFDRSENSDTSEGELEENNANIDGIGCVRVIDNVKIEEKRNSSTKPLYALILTPTRELAIQIKDHLVKAAKYTDIKVMKITSKIDLYIY